uniref:MPN domain-containing protein n=1 Tax=Panagrolaimus sp. JU765 TaxID=591449 RepID=A0AC34R9D8_9BILA
MKRCCGDMSDHPHFDSDVGMYCEENNCNRPNGKFKPVPSIRPKSFRCYEKNFQTPLRSIVNDCNRSCYAAFDENENILHSGCNNLSDVSAYSHEKHGFTCVGDLCNIEQKDRRKCFVGDFGDCRWTDVKYQYWRASHLKPDYCNSWDARDICVHQHWINNHNTSRVCHRYYCQHTYETHGIQLVTTNADKRKSSFNDTINNGTVVVKQCWVNGKESCFMPDILQKIKCYKSTDSTLGKGIICGDFVSHCRITRNLYTKKVISRSCSPPDEAYRPEWGCYIDKNMETCDFQGELSNNVVAKENKCWIGIKGNCEEFKHKIDKEHQHEVKKTSCGIRWNNDCRKTNFDDTCSWHSCEFEPLNNSDSLDSEKDGCHDKMVGEWHVTRCRCSGENCNKASIPNFPENLKMTEVSAIAYSKIILHSARYPHSAVRGFLLGKKIGSDCPPVVVDSIPALHGSLLSAPIEILLMTLDTYCTDHKLQIVGLYFANERIEDKTFDDLFGKVGDKLFSINHSAVMLQVENSKLSPNPESPCLKAYVYENKQWKTSSCFLTNEEIGLSMISAALESKLYRELIDFEAHLDEPNSDVFNSHLTEKLRNLIE